MVVCVSASAARVNLLLYMCPRVHNHDLGQVYHVLPLASNNDSPLCTTTPHPAPDPKHRLFVHQATCSPYASQCTMEGGREAARERKGWNGKAGGKARRRRPTETSKHEHRRGKGGGNVGMRERNGRRRWQRVRAQRERRRGGQRREDTKTHTRTVVPRRNGLG